MANLTDVDNTIQNSKVIVKEELRLCINDPAKMDKLQQIYLKLIGAEKELKKLNGTLNFRNFLYEIGFSNEDLDRIELGLNIDKQAIFITSEEKDKILMEYGNLEYINKTLIQKEKDLKTYFIKIESELSEKVPEHDVDKIIYYETLLKTIFQKFKS